MISKDVKITNWAVTHDEYTHKYAKRDCIRHAMSNPDPLPEKAGVEK